MVKREECVFYTVRHNYNASPTPVVKLMIHLPHDSNKISRLDLDPLPNASCRSNLTQTHACTMSIPVRLWQALLHQQGKQKWCKLLSKYWHTTWVPHEKEGSCQVQFITEGYVYPKPIHKYRKKIYSQLKKGSNHILYKCTYSIYMLHM